MTPASEDRWTVYGRVTTGLDEIGRAKIQGLHLDRATSLQMANSFVEDAIARYKEPCVTAVIVKLMDGNDDPQTRRVVRRVSHGKAWFE
jgi:hypothetical protein